VSLAGLPPAHLRVLLDGLPVFERYGLLLAGGYAFRAHEILHRPSQDLDFATRDGTPLPEIAAQVQLAFQRAGYGVRLAEASPRYARLVLRLPVSGEELEMDLLKEALQPRWVTVQVTPASPGPSPMPIWRTLPAVMILTSTWRQFRIISPGSASSLTKTLLNTGLMSEGSQTCATGSHTGMTTWPSASQQTLPTMKFQMTSDHHARHEPLFVS
jgi:hypothetical protein